MFAPGASVTVNVTGTAAAAEEGLALNDSRLRVLTVTVAVPVRAPTAAVIFAVPVVVSGAVALPLLSVTAVDGEIDPLSRAYGTGKPAIVPPPASHTVATTGVAPPHGA